MELSFSDINFIAGLSALKAQLIKGVFDVCDSNAASIACSIPGMANR